MNIPCPCARTPWPAALIFGLAGSSLLAALAATGSVSRALIVALAPAVIFGLAALIASDRSILVFGALALGMTASPLNTPLPTPGGVKVFAADLVVLLALVSWIAAWLVGDRLGHKPRWPHTPVLRWPLLLLAIALVWAAVRGHEAYGASLIGQPVRFVLYAGIAAAIADLPPAKAYKGIVAVFYTGTVWMLLNAVYYLATGTSQTGASSLSTGGTRVLSLSVAVYLAAALVLALLNLQIDHSATRRLLHVAVAALAAFGVVLAFGRGTFAAIAVILPVLMLFFRRVRGAFVGFLPLCLPFAALAVLLIPRVTPDLGPTLVSRLTGSPTTDLSVRWREEANRAVWAQVQESPLVGVGFGRESSFTLEGVRYVIGQDPHNSFTWLLAGGGVFSLGSFALVLLAFVGDAWRRLRRTSESRERLIIVWSGFALLVILVNTVAGPVLSADPSMLIAMWTLLLLPSIVAPTGGSPRPLALDGNRSPLT